jgi:hypothetical protein
MNGKTLVLTVALVLAAGAVRPVGSRAAAQTADAAADVDIGFFYDRLAVYGDWTQHNGYGWVWYPRGMPIDWRPYTFGHWVYTDDFGWMWDSDLDWGWACFHYGRWDWDDGLGWFWVPGYHWGPAWVAWRAGPGFVGWTPLPPQVRWRVGVGLEFDGFDLDTIPARRWVFVQARYFDAPRIREHEVLRSRNVTILPETRNVTSFEHVDGRVVNASIAIGLIERATHRPVPRFHVRHVDTPSALRLPREHDGEISVFGPSVRRGPAGLAPPRPGEMERRLGAERARVQEQQRAERARQEERHHAERAAPGVDLERLQRRQGAEREALRNEHERQLRQLNSRQRREREAFPRSPAGSERARERPERSPRQR